MKQDLRALFKSNDRGLNANEAFTGRQAEWSALMAALTAHFQRVTSPGFNVEDVEAPRANVLVFHGAGGIGKTTLSHKIESVLASGEDRPAQWSEPTFRRRLLPVRIDLARSAGIDFERVVLTIRLALTRLGRPLPAFDVALRRYWEQTHPGEPLEEYMRRGGLASQVSQALPQQLQSALADVAGALALPSTLGSAVSEVTLALIRALRERRQTVRALAGCSRLADLLEAEPDLDTLSYYPHLLAWDIAQLPAGIVPVILLDTFEDIGDRTHRDLERLLQRLVWLMPNAFFVITGRNRLQWADEALQGQLDFTGPTAWPALTTPSAPSSHSVGETQQVLVEHFTPEDCHDYLIRRLSRDGQPLIDAATRQVITTRSHGLPLFLDLAVQRFLEVRRVREPNPADFDIAFPALISRTVRDLTPDERHVLRSVSLLDSFDIALATKAAGMTHEAAALRLIERPFVLEHPHSSATALGPHHLHEVIRSTVRTADDQTDDRWSQGDWEEAAARAFEALGERWRTSTTRDRLLLVGCLRQGLRIARDFHFDLEWLVEAAWDYVSDSVWEPLAPPTVREPTATTLQARADALVEMLSALSRRRYEQREHTVTRLTAVADTDLLPTELHEMALYYRAKAERDLGRTTASRQIMQPIADGGGRLAAAARRQLAHLARSAGDFPTALATARILGWPGRQHRIEGDVLWAQGDMPRAAAAYEAHRIKAEQLGFAGERAIAQTHRALAMAFTDPGVADTELDLARRLLTGHDERATTLTTQIAALVRVAGTRSTDVESYAQRLRTQVDNVGISAAQTSLEIAIAFHHAVCGNHNQLDTVFARLQDLSRGGDYAYSIDIVSFMADLPLPSCRPSLALWLDGEMSTRARWRSLVTTRQNWYRTSHIRVDLSVDLN